MKFTDQFYNRKIKVKRNLFYHNPRCRKSREGLAIVQSKNIKFEIVEYLQNPPSKEELIFILDGLGMKPLQLITIVFLFYLS
jgi:arsenate reductase-like glutaredoxin family protein